MFSPELSKFAILCEFFPEFIFVHRSRDKNTKTDLLAKNVRAS